jgi:hypothetical protein
MLTQRSLEWLNQPFDWFCDVKLDTLTSVYGVFYYDIVNSHLHISDYAVATTESEPSDSEL